MSKNDIVLSALAMDLKRAALGYHRGSDIMAERFLKEAIKRKNEMNKNKVKPYLQRLLNNVDKVPQLTNDQDKAEESLLLSTLFQNAAVSQSS